jgi:hypothetical protein
MVYARQIPSLNSPDISRNDMNSAVLIGKVLSDKRNYDF